MFEKLRASLSSAFEKITLTELSGKKLDNTLWDLQLALIQNDVAVDAAEVICAAVKDEVTGEKIKRFSDPRPFVLSVVRNTISKILEPENGINLLSLIEEKKAENKPLVIVFVGINGTGKTTTIAKITKYLRKQGYSVVLAASDTFRAGAVEQLSKHGEILGVRVIKHGYQADAAAVAFDAINHAKARHLNTVLIDTAGRMQTNQNLMDEMKKIIRVSQPDLKIFIGDALQGKIYRPVEYLTRLVVGGAHPVYFYIPLICQFYLLAPLVIPLARAKPARLLLISALLQLAALVLRYLYLFIWDVPALYIATDLLFSLYAVPFSLGIVGGFHLQRLKQVLIKARRYLFVALVILAVLVVIESELIFRSTDIRWGAGPGILSTSLYSVVFLLCYLAFDSISIPFPKLFYKLGAMTYGLYLLHPPLLEFFARAAQKFTPDVLAYPVVFHAMLTVAAIGIAFLFMTSISKSPIRKLYRYLFG